MASKSVATLAVSLVARIGGFEKGLKKAQKVAARFSSDLLSHTKTIATYGAAIVGAAATAGTFMVKKQLEAIDATSKASRALGIQTEEYIGLSHAAKLAGISQEQLDSNMARFVKNLDGKAAGPALSVIAEQIKNAGSASEAAKIATDAFGRSGIKMVDLFRTLGKDAIPQAVQEAKSLGIAFSTIDGLKVEAANDAMTRTSQALNGIAMQLAIQVAPYLEVVANRLTNFARQGNQTGEVVTNAFDRITEAAAFFANTFSGINTVFGVFKTGVLAIASSIIGLLSGIAAQVNNIFRAFGLDPIMSEAESFLTYLTERFDKATFSAVEKTRSSFTDFIDGAAGNSVRAAFKGIKAEADKLSDNYKPLRTSPLAVGGGEVADGALKTSEFMQVDLSRVSVGAFSSASGRTKVEDPQLKETNKTLREIGSYLKISRAVVQ